MPEQGPRQDQALSPVRTGLLGRCPRCGKGKLFDGFLSLRQDCGHCGLDYSFIDTGDGPAFFASFIGGFVLLAVAIWVQLRFDPASWIYVVIFVVGALVTVAMIRPLKGLLAALQFANKAEQSHFEL